MPLLPALPLQRANAPQLNPWTEEVCQPPYLQGQRAGLPPACAFAKRQLVATTNGSCLLWAGHAEPEEFCTDTSHTCVQAVLCGRMSLAVQAFKHGDSLAKNCHVYEVLVAGWPFHAMFTLDSIVKAGEVVTSAECCIQ